MPELPMRECGIAFSIHDISVIVKLLSKVKYLTKRVGEAGEASELFIALYRTSEHWWRRTSFRVDLVFDVNNIFANFSFLFLSNKINSKINNKF